MHASLTASPVIDDVPVEPNARQVAAAHRGHGQQLDGEGDLQLDRLGHLEIRIEAMPAPDARRQRKEPIDEPLVLEAAQRCSILLRHPVAAGIEALAQGLQLLQVCLNAAHGARLHRGASPSDGWASSSSRALVNECAQPCRVELTIGGCRRSADPGLVHEGRRERAQHADPSFGADRPDGSTACR
jgi:hypothetical protein